MNYVIPVVRIDKHSYDVIINAKLAHPTYSSASTASIFLFVHPI